MSLVLQINRGSNLSPFDVGHTLPPLLNPAGVYSKRQQTRDILKRSSVVPVLAYQWTPYAMPTSKTTLCNYLASYNVNINTIVCVIYPIVSDSGCVCYVEAMRH